MRAFLAGLLVVTAVSLPMAAADDTAQQAGSTAQQISTTSQTSTTPATSTTTSTAAETKPEHDPVVCKNLGAPLGSRIGNRRVCQHASAWETQMRRDQEQMDKTRQGFAPSN